MKGGSATHIYTNQGRKNHGRIFSKKQHIVKINSEEGLKVSVGKTIVVDFKYKEIGQSTP